MNWDEGGDRASAVVSKVDHDGGRPSAARWKVPRGAGHLAAVWVRSPPPRRKPWSRSARLGENIEVRAKAPYRAASMEIRPGLYVVGELQGEALDFGASLNLSKHLFNAAKSGVKALESKSDKSKKRKGRHARRLAYLQQREQAMAIREHRLREREATMKRFEEWLKRVLPSGSDESSRSPFRRRATPWMGDEDLAGIAEVSEDEPYNLARLMAQWHEDDE